MLWAVAAMFYSAGGTGIYVGQFAGAVPSARIAIVIGPANAVVYICSSDEDFNDAYSRWFRGDASNNPSISFSTDGVTVTGKIANDKVTGQVAGKFAKPQAFQAELVDPDSPAGLYRAQDLEPQGRCTSGWIVDALGETVGSTSIQADESRSLPAKRILTQPSNANAKVDGRLPSGKNTRGEKIFPDSLRPTQANRNPARPVLNVLPGDRLRGTIFGFEREARSLLLSIQEKEFEIPLGNKQLALVDVDGTRLEELAINARGEQPLRTLPSDLQAKLSDLAANRAAIAIRITGGRAELRQAKANTGESKSKRKGKSVNDSSQDSTP